MAHAKHREYTKFYNQFYIERSASFNSTQSAPSSFTTQQSRSPSPSRRRPPMPGDIGYCHAVEKEGKVDLTTLKWKDHHGYNHHGLGLGAAHANQQFVFTQLPGRTFNSKSMASFTQKINDAHRRTVSPIKSRRVQ